MAEEKAPSKNAEAKQAEETEATDEEKAAEDTGQSSDGSAFEVPDAPEVAPTTKYNLELAEHDKREPMMHGMHRTVMIALLAVVIAILGVVLVWFTHEDPVSQDSNEDVVPIIDVQPLGAAATFIEGVAEFHSGDENWTEIDGSVNLAEGYTVRTGSNSRLVITLDDGSAVRLNSDSMATLQTLNSQSVGIINGAGEIYTRVVTSDSRTFSVIVNGDSYDAMGTAYKTSNTADIKGVDVYQSNVKAGNTTVAEGEAYFTQHTDQKKQGTVSKINLDSLKNDEFLKWNAELDKQDVDFADKLGVLEGIDGDENDKKGEKPDTSPAPRGIVASAVKTTSGIKVAWTVSELNTDDGFKVVYSKKSDVPVYGTDASHLVSSKDARSAFLELTDGKKYYVRVCVYRPDQSTCTDYSNRVTVRAPIVEKDPVLSGDINASLSGKTLNWTLDGGTAPYGYEVVFNTSGNPVYPNHNPTYTGDTSKDLSKLELSSGTYHFRVCKWTNGTQDESCVDYSNDVEYVVP